MCKDEYMAVLSQSFDTVGGMLNQVFTFQKA